MSIGSLRQTPGRPLRSSPVRKMVEYLIVYTLCFAVTLWVILSPFREAEHTLIWKTDGMPQYLLQLQYIGEYLRGVIRQILRGDFQFPAYDFEIGMGGDVRTFLKTEPITFLSVMMPKSFSSDFYNALVVLRIYLMGLSFSVYGMYLRKGRAAIFAGSMLYAFSSYTFYQVERHPQFALAAVMLPLLLIGIEQVIHRQNVLFYSLMVGISLFASYYFLYSNTILMGVYALLRVGMVYREHRIKEFFAMLGRIAASYLLGCGLAAAFFAPSIASYFLSPRSSSSRETVLGNLWLYDGNRFAELFSSLSSPMRYTASLTTISVSAFAIPALVVLFVRRVKEDLSLKLAVLLGTLFLMVPVFGFVFSGFSAINNRWSYGFVFLLALVLMTQFDRMRTFTRAQGIGFGVVLLISLACWALQDWPDERLMQGFWLTAGALAVVVLLRLIPRVPVRVWKAAVCLLLCANVSFLGYQINQPESGNMVSEFQRAETADVYYTDSRYRYLAAIEDDSFWRGDTNMMYNNYNNTSVALGYRGISLYNSTIGSGTINYFLESESTGISAVNRTLFMDNRTAQEALACVKYFITTKDGARYVPYGYELDPKLTEKSKTYDIYVNQNQLSIGYSYDTVMARSDYETLSALEKQQAQLRFAVVDDEDLAQFASLETAQTVDANITKGGVSLGAVEEGIEQEGLSFTLLDEEEEPAESTEETEDEEESEDDGAPSVHFSLQAKAGCEVYLRLVGTECSRSVRTDINILTDEIQKRAIVRPSNDTYGLGIADYLVNLGYYEEDEQIDGEMTFSLPGTYSFDALEVYYLPMDTYESEIAALSEASLENVELDDNTVTGTVTTDRDRLMSFSIPYSVGWTATVDGEEVDLVQVNTMYMGIALPEGTHTIELTYQSPGTGIGWIITAISVLLYLVLLVRWIMKRKKR